MRDEDKTKEQLIAELVELRQKDKARTQTMVALRNIEVRYDLLFNNAPVAIFTKDVDGYYTSVNSDTLTYWEHSPIGYRDADLLPEKIAADLRAVDLEVMATQEERYVEEKLMTPHGLRTILSRKVPLCDAGGRVLGILGTSIDITERKLLDQHALQLEIEKERFRLLSEFIMLSSHEFRTPLTLISTSTQLLQRLLNVQEEKIQEYLKRILQQVKHIDLLVDNMMALAKLKEDYTLRSKPIDLNQILGDIQIAKQTMLDDKNIACTLILTPNRLWVEGDVDYLTDAITHILENAIQYTEANGKIILRSYATHARAVIEVVDTGIGLGEEALEHIFEPFYRVDKAGSTRGFGLGLPIAKTIIEQHGGLIEVESTPKKGSTFKISLPLFSIDADS